MHITASGEPITRLAGGLAADDYSHDDDRPPLVLLQGMTFDRTIWRPVVARLHLTPTCTSPGRARHQLPRVARLAPPAGRDRGLGRKRSLRAPGPPR
jgi:hypothetical protein